MTAANHRELHPSTESLSAFSEKALGAQERAQMLEHLSVCRRCREIVALAQEAADAEATPGKIAGAAAAPNAWWTQWRLVWVPAAVVVAFAVTSVSFYLRQVDQGHTAFRVAKQAGMETGHSAGSMPAEQAALTPAPAPPPPAAETSQKRKAAPSSPLSKTQEKKAAEQIALIDSPTREDGSMATRQQEKALARELQALPAVPKMQPSPQPRQFRVDALDGALFAAKPAAASRAAATPVPPPAMAAAQTVTVAAVPPLETAMASGRSSGMIGTPRMATLSAVRMARTLQLPSGLPGVSVAESGGVELAVDRAGAVYRSTDQAAHWTLVLRQWEGRAVTVSAAPMPEDKPEAAPSQKAGASPAPSRPVFEILNDQNQSWLSTDGISWLAK